MKEPINKTVSISQNYNPLRPKEGGQLKKQQTFLKLTKPLLPFECSNFSITVQGRKFFFLFFSCKSVIKFLSVKLKITLNFEEQKQ